MLLTTLGCGDDGGSASGDTTDTTTTGTSGGNELADESTGETGTTTGDEPVCDPPPPNDVDCSGVGDIHVDVDVQTYPEANDAVMSCWVLATGGPGHAPGELMMALGCEVPGGFVVPVELRLVVGDDASTPLHPGQAIELHLAHVDSSPGFTQFAVRDPSTGALLFAGLDGGSLDGHPELFEPFSIGARLDVCQAVGGDAELCSPARAPFVFDIEHEGEVTTVLDGNRVELGDFVVYVEAARYRLDCFFGCPAQSSGTSGLVLGTGFDDPEPEGCNPFAQDCGAAERCVLASSDGVIWDHTTCVSAGALSEGEACTVPPPDDPADDCGPGLVCVGDLDGSGDAHCLATCGDDPGAPVCAPGQTCHLASDERVPPWTCVPACKPHLDDDGCTDEDQACYWWSTYGGVCLDAGILVEGDPCFYINDCGADLVCVNGEYLDGCLDAGCCSPPCSLAAPDCAPDQICTPYFETDPVPGYEDFGVCVDTIP